MIRFVENERKEGRKGYGAACESCRRSKRKCTHLSGNEDSTSSTLPAEHRQRFASSLPLTGPILESRDTFIDGTYEVPDDSSSSLDTEARTDRPLRTTKRRRDGSVERPNKRGTSQKHAAENIPETISSDHDHTPVPSTSRQANSITSSHQGDVRFIGDLNADGVLLAASSPVIPAFKSSNIGVWTTDKGTTTPTTPRDHNGSVKRSNLETISTYDPLLTRHVLPYIEESCLSRIPIDADFDALCGIYFRKFHPIFPVLDYSEDNDNGTVVISLSTLHGKVLVQGMCLAASLHPSAKNHCRFGDGVLLPPRKFADEITLAMRSVLDLGIVTHKPTVMKALFLLSFYTQYSQGDLSSQWSSRAVHHAHSMGIHLASNVRGNRLFPCLWALDRLNAAFHGRPVLMHERDTDLDIQAFIDGLGPTDWARRLLLQIVLQFDKVIGLYRPAALHPLRNIELEFPSFEELVITAKGLRGKKPVLATLEILYHAVSILSCRSTSIGENNKHSSVVSMRQIFSAEKIMEILEEYDDRIINFPFVPYAASLSLGVFYRDLRHNKLRTHQARAKLWLQGSCAALQKLQTLFPPLTSTLKTVSRLLIEIDKVVSSDAAQKRSEPPRKPGDQPAPPPEEGSRRQSSAGRTTDGSSEGDSLFQSATQFESQASVELDTSLLDLYPDFDIFSHLDPDLNLDSIENILQINADLSLPTTFEPL